MKYSIGFTACFIIMAFVNMYCVDSMSQRSDALEVEYNKHLASKELQLDLTIASHTECRATLGQVLEAFDYIEPRAIEFE